MSESKDSVFNKIVSVHEFTAAEGCSGRCNMLVPSSSWVEPLQHLTFCILVLDDGSVITGQSFCPSKSEYEPGFERKRAYDDAIVKLYELNR
jgi:hypothetical protein